MIDALPNIESVYAKWEDKNPHFKNGKLTNHSESSAANGYDATIAKGREAWKSRFSKASAPPPRRVSRRQANNKSRSATIADYHMVSSAEWRHLCCFDRYIVHICYHFGFFIFQLLVAFTFQWVRCYNLIRLTLLILQPKDHFKLVYLLQILEVSLDK